MCDFLFIFEYSQPDTRAYEDDDGQRVGVDPHGSWLSFVRHSSKPSDKKCEREKNKKTSSRGTLVSSLDIWNLLGHPVYS